MNVSSRTLVELPPHIPPTFEVYVNGVRQREGEDFTRRGDELVFPRPLADEGRLGFWRWLSLFLGVAGTYLGVWLQTRIDVRVFYRIVYALLLVTGAKLLYDGVTGIWS